MTKVNAAKASQATWPPSFFSSDGGSLDDDDDEDNVNDDDDTDDDDEEEEEESQRCNVSVVTLGLGMSAATTTFFTGGAAGSIGGGGLRASAITASRSFPQEWRSLAYRCGGGLGLGCGGKDR